MTDQILVGSTARSISVLEALVEEGESGVTALSRALEMPKSTVHKHLSTWVELGYVEQTNEGYKPARRILNLGHRAKQSSTLYDIAKVPVNRLAESTEELVGVYVADGSTGFDLYSERGPRSLLDETTFEISHQLHCNAAGKAILSRAPESLFEAVVEGGLQQQTENTVDDPAELADELERIRNRNVAFDRGEQKQGFRSVAVPLDLPDTLAAAYVTAPTDRMRGKRFEENIPGLLSNTANQIASDYRDVHK